MEAAPRSGEAEHGKGNGNWDVDTDLPHVYFVNELPGVAAVRCEDGCAVAIRIGVDDFYGFIQSIGIHDAQDWTKYFFLVALVVRFHIRQKGWTYKVTVGVLVHFDRSAVQRYFCSLQINYAVKYQVFSIHWVQLKKL